MKCPNCLMDVKMKKEDLHPLGVCSLACLKVFKEKKGIKYKPFDMKMIPQKGRGKHHCQWIAKG